MEFTVKSEKRRSARSGAYYIAKVLYKGILLNITYTCLTQNLIIHEWYKLSNVELDGLTTELINYFNTKEKTRQNNYGRAAKRT